MFNRFSKIALLSFLAAGLLVMSGCSKKPKGFPKVYPCKISVTCDGQPVENAVIALIPKDRPAVVYNSAGRTQSDGTAPIATSIGTYVKQGAPKGDFYVTVREELKVELTPEQIAAREQCHSLDEVYQWGLDTADAQQAALDRLVVPSYYANKNETTLELTITGPTDQTFEVENKNAE